MGSPRPPPDQGRKAMTVAERGAFFAALAKQPAPVRALLRFLYETASRVTEALHAKWTDVDTKNKLISIPRLKRGDRGKTVRIEVSSKLIALLREARGRGDLLFPGSHRCEQREKGKKHPRGPMAWEKCPGGHVRRKTVNAWMEVVGLAAGLHPGLRHPHTLKHARLSDLGRHYKDKHPSAFFKELREFSGHATAEALFIYLDEPEGRAERMGQIRDELERI